MIFWSIYKNSPDSNNSKQYLCPMSKRINIFTLILTNNTQNENNRESLG